MPDENSTQANVSDPIKERAHSSKGGWKEALLGGNNPADKSMNWVFCLLRVLDRLGTYRLCNSRICAHFYFELVAWYRCVPRSLRSYRIDRPHHADLCNYPDLSSFFRFLSDHAKLIRWAALLFWLDHQRHHWSSAGHGWPPFFGEVMALLSFHMEQLHPLC